MASDGVSGGVGRGEGASADLYERAARVLPGGVTAGARANRALGRPFYIERGDGPYVFDPEGRRYVDVCTSNGASLLGHGHPAVVAAVRGALERGLVCAYDGSSQVALAEALVEQVPSLEMVRFTTTGTEATLYAVRVARAATGRARVLKFEGHFHGYNDPLAYSFWPTPAEGGPAQRPRARPESQGLPPSALGEVVVASFNDAAAFRAILDEVGDDLAAVVLEPINYDSGAILPAPGFLELVRDETARRGIVLVFDEILSGYRTGVDCAQGYLGITPDLCTLGKALGGGAPLSAFGGRRDLMAHVSPVGRAVHTGTYNAHLIPVLAALAFLETASAPGFYDHLLGLSERLCSGLQRAFDESGLAVRVQGVGARFALYFGLDPRTEVTGYRQASALDWETMSAFCREIYARGVYVNPAWHHGISSLHTEALVDEVVAKAAEAARAVAKSAR